MLLRLTSLLLICLPASLFAAGKIYTWTDDNGVVHYGDRPPMEVSAEEVAVQGKKRAPISVNKEQVPGQWFGRSNDGGEVKITLNESGTINFIQTRADQSIYNYQGIWTLEGTTLSVITEFSQSAPANGEMKRSVEPVQITYNILSFSAESMELISDGERFSVDRLN